MNTKTFNDNYSGLVFKTEQSYINDITVKDPIDLSAMHTSQIVKKNDKNKPMVALLLKTKTSDLKKESPALAKVQKHYFDLCRKSVTLRESFEAEGVVFDKKGIAYSYAA